MTTTKDIIIHNENSCSWCEYEYNFFIYGRNEDEIREALVILCKTK